jgi:hypothetical protein
MTLRMKCFAFFPCLVKLIAEVKDPPIALSQPWTAGGDNETAGALLPTEALTLPDVDESFHFNKYEDESQWF